MIKTKLFPKRVYLQTKLANEQNIQK